VRIGQFRRFYPLKLAAMVMSLERSKKGQILNLRSNISLHMVKLWLKSVRWIFR